MWLFGRLGLNKNKMVLLDLSSTLQDTQKSTAISALKYISFNFYLQLWLHYFFLGNFLFQTPVLCAVICLINTALSFAMLQKQVLDTAIIPWQCCRWLCAGAEMQRKHDEALDWMRVRVWKLCLFSAFVLSSLYYGLHHLDVKTKSCSHLFYSPLQCLNVCVLES